MELNVPLLEQHASHVRDRIEEQAFFFDVEDAACFGLLYRPAGGPLREPGFAVCHSYGLEVITLRRTERAIARELAALGHPVLAFHRRGFGDSAGSLAEATLERQLADTRAAAAELSRRTGVERLGLIGARLGALIAAMVADRGGIERLVLLNPASSGREYFRRMIREMHLVQLSDPDEKPARSSEQLMEDLAGGGVADVLGFPIHRHLHTALRDVDLAGQLASFTGDVLLLQIAKRAGLARDVEALRDALQHAGARVRTETFREPAGTTFGGVSFVSTGDPMTREDVQADLVERIAAAVAAWIR